MKKLNLVERILVVVSTVLILCAFAFSYLFDESAGVPGLLTFGTTYSVVGVFLIVVATCLGLGLYLSQKEGTAKTIGICLLLAANIIVFAACTDLFVVEEETGASEKEALISMSQVLGLIGAIVFFLALILWGLRAFANIARPVESNDPEDDPQIKLVLKWRTLLEEGVITEEEYQAKRVSILGLDSKKDVKGKDHPLTK